MHQRTNLTSRWILFKEAPRTAIPLSTSQDRAMYQTTNLTSRWVIFKDVLLPIPFSAPQGMAMYQRTNLTSRRIIFKDAPPPPPPPPRLLLHITGQALCVKELILPLDGFCSKTPPPPPTPTPSFSASQCRAMYQRTNLTT